MPSPSSALLLCAALGALLPPRTHAYLHGIDVSRYQNKIDWAAVARNVSFVSIKATEGADFTDPSFHVNWAGAHANGIVRTAYHFAHPSVSAVAQADYFVDAVNSAGGYANSSTMQLMLDLEDADKESPSVVWAWVQAFSARVKVRTGRPLLMYTGFYFWRDSVGNPTDNLDAPLWIAAYIPTPLIPTAWAGVWTFWQHADNGSVPGITGNVDLDYFNGSEEDLRALCFP